MMNDFVGDASKFTPQQRYLNTELQKSRSLETVRKWLSQGADMRTPVKIFNSYPLALYLTHKCKKREQEECAILNDYGTPEVVNYIYELPNLQSRTLLFEAIMESNDLYPVELMLSLGGNYNLGSNEASLTPLNVAVAQKKYGIAIALIAAGADDPRNLAKALLEKKFPSLVPCFDFFHQIYDWWMSPNDGALAIEQATKQQVSPPQESEREQNNSEAEVIQQNTPIQGPIEGGEIGMPVGEPVGETGPQLNE